MRMITARVKDAIWYFLWPFGSVRGRRKDDEGRKPIGGIRTRVVAAAVVVEDNNKKVRTTLRSAIKCQTSLSRHSMKCTQ